MSLFLDKTGQVDGMNIPVAEVFVDRLPKTLVAAWFAVPAFLVVNNGFAHPNQSCQVNNEQTQR